MIIFFAIFYRDSLLANLQDVMLNNNSFVLALILIHINRKINMNIYSILNRICIEITINIFILNIIYMRL